MASQRVLTLLLTDIEGSTALWEAAPERMSVALDRHDALVAEAVTRAGGRLVKSKGEGDATFSVFELASAAVTAAVDLRDQLDAERWDPDTPIHVRMSIYTGEVEPRDGDYFGSSVNRAARLRSFAAGDQVLVSAATASMIRDRLPEGVKLIDLGEHRLRDVARPEHIYELGVRDPEGDDATARLRPRWAVQALASGMAGRQREYEQLAELWDHVQHDRRGLVLVSGEPGIGKTTLAAAVACAVHDAGGAVLYGRWEGEHHASYQAFRQALTQHADACATGVLRNDIGSHMDEIARLVPEVASRVGGARPPVAGEPEAERLRLFDAVDKWIAAISARRPVLLVLDDVHWADSSSLLLLRHLLESYTPARLLVIATVRAQDHGRADVDRTIGSLHRSVTISHVRLGGLDPTAIAELIDDVQPGVSDTAATALAQTLSEETAGNPFFLQQIIRHLTKIGALELETLDALDRARTDVPDSLRDVVQWRLGLLGEPCRRAISTAAVLGTTFDIAVVALVLDMSELELLDLLDEASEAGLVSESGERYTFVHAVVARMLVDQFTQARLTRVHRRVADVLATMPRADAAEVAHHYRAAAPSGVSDEAIEWTRRAAAQATADAAFETAAQLLEAAVVVANEHGTVDSGARCELMLDLATAYDRAGDFARRDPLNLEVAELARSLDRDDLFIRAALGFRGQLPSAVLPDRDALSLVREALDRAGPTATESRALLLARLAHLLHFRARHDERDALCREALEVARRTEDDAVVASVMITMTLALDGPDDVDEQLRASDEILAIAAQLRNPELELQAYRIRLGAELELDVSTALRTASTMKVLAEKVRHPDHLRLVRMIEIMQDGACGRYDVAHDGAEALRADLTRMGHTQAEAIPLFQTFSWHWFRADVEGVVKTFEVMMDRQPRTLAWRAIHAWALTAVDLDAVRADLERVSLDDLRGLDQNYSWMFTVCGLAMAAARTRHAPIASVVYDVLLPYEDRFSIVGFAAFHGSVQHYLGSLATVLGRDEEAITRLERALAEHRRLGALPYVALTASELAVALRSRDDDASSQRAAALDDEVAHLAENLDLRLLRAPIRD